MRLLRDLDYKQLIQDDVLQQIIQSDKAILLQVEQVAQAEIKGYLAQRYSVDKIFTDTAYFNIATTYSGNSLVEYTEPAFLSATSYSTADRVSCSGTIYTALSGSTNLIPGSSGASYSWSAITEDKNLYYAIVGDSISFSGYYPDDVSYWVKGDNRNPQLLQNLIDLTLFHLYSRINPRLITELRVIRNEAALKWLRDVAKGIVIADLPTIKPTTGLSITWGFTDFKRTNGY